MEPIGQKHLLNVYSQNGEDGIIAEIFNRIGEKSRCCFEFGAADGKWMSNTRALTDAGWEAVLIEADKDKYAELLKLSNSRVRTFCGTVTPENVEDFLGAHSYDLGVIDIDGQDYYVWLGMTKIRPRVMVVEFDPQADPNYVPERGGTGQAGIDAIVSVGIAKGYRPVCQVGPNMIFVVCEEWAKLGMEWLDPQDPPAPKLNIGGGNWKLDGYHNVDRKAGEEAYPLRYKDNSVDEVRASHVLEHFSHRETLNVLKEWVRVLKPGGVLKVAVPNFAWVCSMYQANASDPLLGAYVMGGHTDSDDKHGALFDYESLKKLMADAGLMDIEPWTDSVGDCASLPVSLNLQGTKPVERTEQVKIRAILSLPRFGLNDFWQTAIAALKPFGIPICTFKGVFWGQCMQRAMAEAIKDGVEWLLCLDYDSMFTADDVKQLLHTFCARPDIDALAALQCRRGSKFPLFTAGGATEVATDGSPILVTSAHFGLTLLRLDKVKQLPKPWFIGKPDENGEWGDNRLDDDVWFWHQWRLAGNNIYVDPKCNIGHMEEMIVLFGDDGKPVHLYPVDWRRKHGLANPVREAPEDAKEVA